MLSWKITIKSSYLILCYRDTVNKRSSDLVCVAYRKIYDAVLSPFNKYTDPKSIVVRTPDQVLSLLSWVVFILLKTTVGLGTFSNKLWGTWLQGEEMLKSVKIAAASFVMQRQKSNAWRWKKAILERYRTMTICKILGGGGGCYKDPACLTMTLYRRCYVFVSSLIRKRMHEWNNEDD